MRGSTGEHDDAAAILGLLPRLSALASPHDVLKYLRTIPQPKGTKEQDDALFKLGQLGYTSGS